MRSSWSALATLAAVASAQTTPQTGSQRNCQNATVPVQVSVRTGVFGNVAVPHTNLEVTTFIQNMTQQGRNFTQVGLTDYNTTTGEYMISTQFCSPASAASNSSTSNGGIVQILTHGIGFDKTYWDLSYNAYNYSYVDAALAAGYSTLSYDRLGIGNSSKGDPLNEIQAQLEIESLAQLTMMLRNGTFPGVDQAFERTVHVGHSFGSAQTYGLVANYPDITDGVVLTGFTINTTFLAPFLAGGNFQLASLNAPIRFGDTTPQQIQQYLIESPFNSLVSGVDVSTVPPGQNLPDGYLISENAQNQQFQFFYPGGFDPQLLVLGEQTKQPVTLGELLTIGSTPMMQPFSGPVFVINGQGDVPFCGGDCLATGLPDVPDLGAPVAMAFPSVEPSNFASYVQLNTGHGLNFHYNSTGAYQVIQSFLADHGLSA